MSENQDLIDALMELLAANKVHVCVSKSDSPRQMVARTKARIVLKRYVPVEEIPNGLFRENST